LNFVLQTDQAFFKKTENPILQSHGSSKPPGRDAAHYFFFVVMPPHS